MGDGGTADITMIELSIKINLQALARSDKRSSEQWHSVSWKIATNGNSHIDVKDLLIALKKRLSPRTADRQYEIWKKYQNLQKMSKQNLDQ
ncbi:hypothetical protein I7I48_06338 [Histoplasma ohiense]|nr:hypothetical protein I7I48_06338 [Histoplasma ohiense (nom. inval.)]